MARRLYGGRWRAVDSVGGGGQADVVRVHDASQEHQGEFALKRLRDRDRLDRFRREVEALRAIDHQGVAQVVDFDTEGEPAYYVLRYFPRGNARTAGVPTWSIEKRFTFFEQVLDAMAAVHARGIVHRDLKPDNILVADDDRAVVADFGICHFEDGNRITLTGEVVGARFYAAPELEEGPVETVRPVSDVWSLGKMLYWLYGGRDLLRVPHRQGEWNLVADDDARYEHVNVLLDKMLVGVAERLPTAGEVLSAFRRARDAFFATINVPGVGRQKCIYCGFGQYLIRRPNPEQRDFDHIAQRFFGGHNLLTLVCKSCGNVQLIDLDRAKDFPHQWEGSWIKKK